MFHLGLCTYYMSILCLCLSKWLDPQSSTSSTSNNKSFIFMWFANDLSFVASGKNMVYCLNSSWQLRHALPKTLYENLQASIDHQPLYIKKISYDRYTRRIRRALWIYANQLLLWRFCDSSKFSLFLNYHHDPSKFNNSRWVWL